MCLPSGTPAPLNKNHTMLEDFRLKIFVTVAQKQSFTQAATSLGITQPAVSQNIASLESETGVKLVSRSASGIELTPQGKVFLHYAEKILAAYRETGKLFSNTGMSERVSVYADTAAREYALPGILNVIRDARPALEVSMAENSESADIRIISTLYSRNGTMLLSFDVRPDTHPLSEVFASIIRDQNR